jgi:hypothetical protein
MSFSVMTPLSLEKASAFWRQVAAAEVRGERAVAVAEDADGIIGTVQLVVDLTENQLHRADLSKMLVHRRAAYSGRRRIWRGSSANRCSYLIPQVPMPSGSTPGTAGRAEGWLQITLFCLRAACATRPSSTAAWTPQTGDLRDDESADRFFHPSNRPSHRNDAMRLPTVQP